MVPGFITPLALKLPLTKQRFQEDPHNCQIGSPFHFLFNTQIFFLLILLIQMSLLCPLPYNHFAFMMVLLLPQVVIFLSRPLKFFAYFLVVQNSPQMNFIHPPPKAA
jgi:hypothetical protein